MKTALLLIALLTLASGCASRGPLYDELGARDGLGRIAARFVANIGDDDIIRPYFEHTNLDRFYRMFSLHLCVVADGPCEYPGDDMVATHEGMEISEADFNRTVDLLINAMDDEGIPHTVQNRLLNRLAPLREDIIYH